MSALSDQLHIAVVENVVPGYKDAPAEVQQLIETASDAVVDIIDFIKWIID